MPPKVANQLLLKLADDPYANPHDIAFAVDHYFNKMCPNVRNELLLKLAEKKEAVYMVEDAVDHHYNKIPSELRNKIASHLEIGRRARGFYLDPG